MQDDTFQDLIIDFLASLGSDHMGLWLMHHLLQAVNQTPQNSWLPPYIVQDTVKKVWITKFREDARIPAHTLDWVEIEAESTCLSSYIEETKIATFKQHKEFSPRGAQW